MLTTGYFIFVSNVNLLSVLEYKSYHRHFEDNDKFRMKTRDAIKDFVYFNPSFYVVNLTRQLDSVCKDYKKYLIINVLKLLYKNNTKRLQIY